MKRNPIADSSSPPSWIESYCHVLTYNFNINACVHNVKTEMLEGIRLLTSPSFPSWMGIIMEIEENTSQSHLTPSVIINGMNEIKSLLGMINSPSSIK